MLLLLCGTFNCKGDNLRGMQERSSLNTVGFVAFKSCFSLENTAVKKGLFLSFLSFNAFVHYQYTLLLLNLAHIHFLQGWSQTKIKLPAHMTAAAAAKSESLCFHLCVSHLLCSVMHHIQ